jgi:NitT/TauT family transport system ATP-binding protein
MDEPFGSLDAQTREDLVLRVRAERDITVLLVTHDIDESVYVGDRVVVLTRAPGRVRAEIQVSSPSKAPNPPLPRLLSLPGGRVAVR